MAKLESLANLAVLIVAIIAGIVLLRSLSGQAAPVRLPMIAAGDRLAISGVDWSRHRQTLLMAIQSSCHFCSESAPFYRRMLAATSTTGVHVTAVLPEPQRVGMEYVRSLGITLDDVREASFSALKIRGTPTVMLVDERGVVRKVWMGKLSASREDEVIDTIVKTSAHGQK